MAQLREKLCVHVVSSLVFPERMEVCTSGRATVNDAHADME